MKEIRGISANLMSLGGIAIGMSGTFFKPRVKSTLVQRLDPLRDTGDPQG